MSLEQLTLFEDEKNFREHLKYRNGVFKSKEEIINELKREGKERIYHVLSFGGGTQSAHLYDAHLKGELDYKYDLVIFSDTGAEPDFIHEQVAWWKQRKEQFRDTTPFICTHHKSMKGGLEEMLFRYLQTDYQRYQMVTYFSKLDPLTGQEVPAGLTKRQCTIDFKIVPVKQAARKWVMESIGLDPSKRMPKDVAFIIDIGFSYDEIRRINTYKSPQFKYMYLSYPLVEKGLTTDESIQFLQENQFPMKRSRCYLCPFNCDNREIGMDWGEIIRDEGLSFLKACYFDAELRRVLAEGKKALTNIPYFHYKRIPLREAYPEDYKRLKNKYHEQLETWIESWSDLIKKKYSKTVAS